MAYPTDLDVLNTPSPSDSRQTNSLAGRIGDAYDAIERTQAELGLDPSGTSATVRARLDLVDGPKTPVPTGALAETAPRYLTSANTALLSSGRITAAAIVLPKGQTVTSISFVSATTALSSGTNQWFGLFDSSRVKLMLTADNTSTAWAADAVKTLTLTTPFVTTYSGVHYVGIMVAASTVPSLACFSTGIVATKDIVPVICGSCDTGLTNPASCPTTLSNFPTAASVTPYAYVS